MFVQRIALFGLTSLLLLNAILSTIHRSTTARTIGARLDRLDRVVTGICPGAEIEAHLGGRPQPMGSILASWETVGGCGASAASGSGLGGPKWVGRNVSGGLFGVQCQATYSPLLSNPAQVEHNFVLSTLVTKALSERWSFGANLPFVYKYLRDPYGLNVDLSNGGLGDVWLQVTRKVGPIGATALTASVGLPTGTSDTQYKMKYLRQHQQLGFGRVAASLAVDHTMDETWGLVVLGGSGSWRGGENRLGNYRAAAGSAYGYAGYFLGPFVPALGLSVTGFTGHDRDRTEDENSALFAAAANVSVEWSTDWVALLAGASLPLQYDGVHKDSQGVPRSPWGFGSWMVSVGVSLSPF